VVRDSSGKFVSEIIEFPLVVLDAKTLRVVSEFHSYIRPVHNPTLTAFCTQLTGIEQSTVDAAEPFDRVWPKVLQFVEKVTAAEEQDQDGAKALKLGVLTCGDWDLKTMLPAQLKLSGLGSVPAAFSEWINVKKSFNKHYGGFSRGMSEMLEKLHLALQGRHHSGIDDARNIARIARKLLLDGCALANTWQIKK